MRKKKTFKLSLGIFLMAVSLLISQIPVQNLYAAEDNTFTVEEGTLIKYRGTDKTVSVPSTVNHIASTAFVDNTFVEKIILPNTVTDIDAFSFWGCNSLKEVTLGAGITEIKDYAFANCKGLTTMSLTDNVISIGLNAFQNCYNFKDIYIKPSTLYIDENAFSGCFQLIIHAVDGSVASKYAEGFYERQKEMAQYIPDEKIINNETADADDDDSFKPVFDPDNTGVVGATQIVGNSAFMIPQGEMKVYSGNPWEQDIDKSFKMLVDSTKESNNMTIHTLLDDKIVADKAYYTRDDIYSLIIPNSVKEIGQFSFARTTLEQVVMQDGLETISNGAFYHSDRLYYVCIPDTVTNVEPNAFGHTLLVDNFIRNSSADFLVCGDVLIAYKGISNRVTIPSSVRLIAADVFKGHTEILELVIPDSVKIICEGAFEDCLNLKKVTFGKNITTLRDRAFYSTKIDSISIPASVKEMGIRVFNDDCNITYSDLNNLPAKIHEVSAETLSNEYYRGFPVSFGISDVYIRGLKGAVAILENCEREYTLDIMRLYEDEPVIRAFARNTHYGLPPIMAEYQLDFSDGSLVPIKKLGERFLSLFIPLGEEFIGKHLQAVIVDRNGQLKNIPSQIYNVEDKSFIRVDLDYVSKLIIYADNQAFDESKVISENTVITAMSEIPQAAKESFKITYDAAILIKYFLSAIVSLSGLLFVISAFKTKK